MIKLCPTIAGYNPDYVPYGANLHVRLPVRVVESGLGRIRHKGEYKTCPECGRPFTTWRGSDTCSQKCSNARRATGRGGR